MPGLCHFVLFRRELTKSQMFMDLGLAVVGVILAIVGTQDAVIKYFEKYGADAHIPTGGTGIEPHITQHIAEAALPHTH